MKLTAYHPSWPALFEAERARLLTSTANLGVSIEHVGSTAVPGMISRPMIDMLVGSDDQSNLESLRNQLTASGYRAVDAISDNRRETPYVHRRAEIAFTLHIVLYGSAEWRDAVALRDLLRQEPDVATHFINAKLEAAASSTDDYSSAKRRMLAELVRRARARPRPAAPARVFLREPREEDRDAYVHLIDVSRAAHRPWIPLTSLEPTQLFSRLLLDAQGGRSDKRLLCRLADDAVLGAINVNEIVSGAFQSGYLGYWIGAPYARNGYMSEGLVLAVERAFNELALHRLEANIMPHNTASLSLVRRLGFRREGFSPRYLCIAGKWADHERWALLKEDWLQQGSRSE